jgi:hypothetical protein
MGLGFNYSGARDSMLPDLELELGRYVREESKGCEWLCDIHIT